MHAEAIRDSVLKDITRRIFAQFDEQYDELTYCMFSKCISCDMNFYLLNSIAVMMNGMKP